MLADTAKSTLREQLAADSSRGRMAYSPSQGDAATKLMAQNSPEDISRVEMISSFDGTRFRSSTG